MMCGLNNYPPSLPLEPRSPWVEPVYLFEQLLAHLFQVGFNFEKKPRGGILLLNHMSVNQNRKLVFKIDLCRICQTVTTTGRPELGGHKEMSSIQADQQRPRIGAQMGGGGGGGCAGVSANDYSCAHLANINFGDLTPYLTYAQNVI